MQNHVPAFTLQDKKTSFTRELRPPPTRLATTSLLSVFKSGVAVFVSLFSFFCSFILSLKFHLRGNPYANRLPLADLFHFRASDVVASGNVSSIFVAHIPPPCVFHVHLYPLTCRGCSGRFCINNTAMNPGGECTFVI